MSLDQFQIIAKLGDGSYSSVYKVKRIEDNEIYALKKVKIQNLSDREKENALNEVRILASIKNPFVAAYKHAFFDESSSSLCIVMEFADDGDVFQKICECQNNKQFMKEKHIWKIVIQVVRGLRSLHDLQILHRDMKSANIFLYKDQTAKLGDLNVSKIAKKGLLYTQTGTPYYASPEVWKDQPYDLKSDIWSLGCVTYEMCALVPPFRADDMNGLFKRVLKGQYPPIPSHYSMDMRMLIKTLLQVQASHRPTTEQILEMPIVIKRIKKYFPGQEAYLVPGLFEDKDADPSLTLGAESDQLLQTIKLQKNVFKLSLPGPAYSQSGAGQNFQTIPGSKVNAKSRGRDKSPGMNGMKMTSNVTKTTAITNSKQSLQIDDINASNVALPKINKLKSNLAIDDDNEGDYVPQKPKNISRLGTDQENEDKKLSPTGKQLKKQRTGEGDNGLPVNVKGSSSVEILSAKNINQARRQPSKQGGLLPQVSGRSRKSLEEIGTHNDAYSVGNINSGLNQSPSVISLHGDQTRGSNGLTKKRSSKESSLRRNNRGGSSADPDEYTDEIKMVTDQYGQQSPIGGLPKSNKKDLVMRGRPGISQSALEHGGPPAIGKSRHLAHSPSGQIQIGKGGNDGLSQYSGHGLSSNKKKLLLNGQNSQAAIQTGSNSGIIQIQGHSGQNYKRIVNIYSVNNYKKKRQSHAPESRVVLNHSMLPNQNVQSKIGVYDDRRHHGRDIQLPEIGGGGKYHGSNEINSVGRPYAYKSTIDQQNSAMIAKLMSRKKSYERMMKLEDGLNGRSPNTLHHELNKQKNSEVLLTGNRGGSMLSRANHAGNSNRKQLNYYESTPQQPRKGVSHLKKQLISSNNNKNSSLLDVQGQNMQKQHGKSSAYLPASSSLADLNRRE